MVAELNAAAPLGRRELVVLMDDSPAAPAMVRRGGAPDISAVLRQFNATVEPIFEPAPVRSAVRGLPAAPGPALSDAFYAVDAKDEQMDALASALKTAAGVKAAYVKPPTTNPVRAHTGELLALPAAPTPDFLSRQGYLTPSPAGVDALWAWTQPGGKGEGIRIVDVEGGWQFTHEDLLQSSGGLIGGTPQPQDAVSWRNHGTAVLGEIGGDHNGVGVSGISPNALLMAVSHGTLGSARAIKHATDRLSAGDVILLEMHRPGPAANFLQNGQQHGYIAVEWWPDDFAAIQRAVQKGIIVVEAAGNGAQNLDDPIYDAPASGFPAGWVNPFKRAPQDSGAIIVGAGAPPPGTNGQNHGPNLSRLDFSNFGACVDVQGWGRAVTSCGYGDLHGLRPGQPVLGEDRWYTDIFSGTSSASPIVTAVVACLHGMARARRIAPFSAATLRGVLRTVGAQQTDANTRPATQRIGPRPDLPALAAALGLAAPPGPPASARKARKAAKPKKTKKPAKTAAATATKKTAVKKPPAPAKAAPRKAPAKKKPAKKR